LIADGRRLTAYPSGRGEAAMSFINRLFGWILGIGLMLWLGAKLILDAIGRAVTAGDLAGLDAEVAKLAAWVFNAAPWWVPAALASALILTALAKSLFRARPAVAQPAPEAIAPAESDPPEDDKGEQEHLAPIHEAIDHIAKCTDDSITRDCYAATRDALRRHAGEGRIRIRGCKQMDDPAKPVYSEVETDVPQDYWAISSIGPMAVDADFADNGHTFPEPVGAWGSKGLFAKKAYSRLRVDWDDVVRLWPAKA
jgi:hypothetical protein